jgi:antitoxin (DNA-binding transcriptional repressor) of toxin-antitoxin stability system
MAKTVTVEQAEGHLDELMDLAASGEVVVIEKGDQSKVKLTPIPHTTGKKRVFGRHKGQIWMSDDFDDPLPDEFWLGGNP